MKAVAEEYGHQVRPLFLPGETPPEQWLWNTARGHADDYAPRLGLTPADMERKMRDLEQLLGGAVQQRDLAKTALSTFAADLDRTVPEIARIVGQREAERNAIPELLVDLKEQVSAWRRL